LSNSPAQQPSPITLAAVDSKLDEAISDLRAAVPSLTLHQKIAVTTDLEKIVKNHCHRPAPNAAAEAPAAKTTEKTTEEAATSKDPQAKRGLYEEIIGTQTQQRSKKAQQAREREAAGADDRPELQKRTAKRVATVRNKTELLQPKGGKRKGE
jgi:hypothetical protein